MSLFDPTPLAAPSARAARAPLAERMRPRTLDDVLGQGHLLGPGKPLRLALQADDPQSMILWGPPGIGKTTLAKLIATLTSATFLEFSAVLSGIKEIRDVMSAADRAHAGGLRTILFIDEIHRFNKAQQDAFLPFVERGAIRLIGATTENPSFEINAALLSRCRVYTLQALSETDLTDLLARALADPDRGLGALHLAASPDTLARLAVFSNGDARSALNALEAAANIASGRHLPAITPEIAAEAQQRRILLYDKRGEQHFDLISALHKSVRNSDPHAALYWLARMLEAGEDPLYVARRIIRMAVEDIGLAAPEALNLCLSARDTMHLLGHPEGDLALAEAVVYLALAPKSNAVYTAFAAAQQDVQSTAADPVPLHLRNAPTRLMKDLDYGRDYQYAHDHPEAITAMTCLPPSLADRRYYQPTDRGRERQLRARMDEIAEARAASRSPGPDPDST